MTGYASKRQAALDKLFEVENELGLHYDQRTPMTKDEALTLEALKYAASMGHGGMVKEMFAPFTIKSTLAQPAQEQWLQDVSIKIKAALLSHRLSMHNDADDAGNGFPLVDALCCGQTSLDIGKREVEDIVEAIYHVLDANIPTAAQPAQEPVAWAIYDKRGGSKSLHWPENHSPNGDATRFDAVPLYATPPQRPWVGLTDKQMDEWTPEIHGVIRSIEAALKEKNFD